MAVEVSYPGVYLKEIPSKNPVVAGVSTSNTAFVDFFTRGPMEEALKITNQQQFERFFGGLDTRSEASYGIQQYFMNGGKTAWVIRTAELAETATCGVKIKNMTLEERKTVVGAYKTLAKKAAGDAKSAADSAKDITFPATEGKEDFEAFIGEAGKTTKKAAIETGKAARQAESASKTLAAGIDQLRQASGIDRLAVETAQKAAAAAGGTAKSAEKVENIIGAAISARDMSQQVAGPGGSKGKLGAALASLDTLSEVQRHLKEIEARQKALLALLKGDQDNATREDVSPQEVREAAVQVQEAATYAKRAAETLGSIEGADTSALKTEFQSNPAEIVSDAQLVFTVEEAKPIAERCLAAIDQVIEVTLKEGGETVLKIAAAALKVLAKDLKTESKIVANIGVTSPSKATNVAGKILKPTISLLLETQTEASATISNSTTAAKVAEKATDKINPAWARDVINVSEGLEADLEQEQVENQLVFGRFRSAADASNRAAQSTLNAENALKEEAPAAFDKFVEALGKTRELFDFADTVADHILDCVYLVTDAADRTASMARLAARGAENAANAAGVAVEAFLEANKEPMLILKARNPGHWGNALSVQFDIQGVEFRLQVQETVRINSIRRVVAQEVYPKLNLDPDSALNVWGVLAKNSDLLYADRQGLILDGAKLDVSKRAYPLGGGKDGQPAKADGIVKALDALDQIRPDVFNILCLPATAKMSDGEVRTLATQAQNFCAQRRAFYILDIPQEVDTPKKAKDWTRPFRNGDSIHMATYFPRVLMPDPLKDYRPRNVGASGTLAGVYARTDGAVGVWKAPAGVDSVLRGVDLAVPMTDEENGELNVLGVNALRNFAVYGTISWGARTLAGADLLMSEYKYLNTRRLMNYVEESVFNSLKWAVFESNTPVLWQKISLQVSSFLAGLFTAGAFRGSSPGEAFFVLCDGTTTTAIDIERGIVNVHIGIAPVKPAEFVVLQFQQIAQKAA